MEIRRLDEREVQAAVEMTHEVFETYMRRYLRSQSEAEQFYAYVNIETLRREMSEGRLLLWGAFEAERLCGVAGMQPGGHITMLYVIPQRFGERIGTRLLYTMCTCARDVYHQERITVHVLPMAAAPYFYHRGFGMIPNAAVGIFLPLEGRAAAILPKRTEVVYRIRRIKTWHAAVIAAGVLTFCTLILVGATFWQMML